MVKPLRCCPWCDAPLLGDGAAAWEGLRVDWSERRVWWQDKPAPRLPPLRCRMLHVLVTAKGKAVSRTQLRALLNQDTGPESLTVHMSMLRRWLAETGLPFAIPVSEPHQGYALVRIDVGRPTWTMLDD